MDNVEKRINDLSVKELNHFTWLCGVRILPFLGGHNEFSYWGDKVQTHLNSVFFALDKLASFSKEHSFESINNKDAIAKPVFDATRNVYVKPPNSVIKAIYHLVIDDVVSAISFVNSALSHHSDKSVEDKFQKIMLSDIEALLNNDKKTLCNDTTIYGELWESFINDLKKVGCDYWAELYANLFENRFEIDDELDTRIVVSDEHKAEGAADLGEYLKERQGMDTQSIDEVRIIIIGQAAAGKTSLARRLLDADEKMPDANSCTLGIRLGYT